MSLKSPQKILHITHSCLLQLQRCISPYFRLRNIDVLPSAESNFSRILKSSNTILDVNRPHLACVMTTDDSLRYIVLSSKHYFQIILNIWDVPWSSNDEALMNSSSTYRHAFRSRRLLNSPLIPSPPFTHKPSRRISCDFLVPHSSCLSSQS